jgi:hypothetical protein
MRILFFDIGETLATAKIASHGTLTFIVLPRVLESLAALNAYRKGVLSNPGTRPGDVARANNALDASPLGHFFPEQVLRVWGEKSDETIFVTAANRAGVPTSECIFVGESGEERALASAAGMRTAPHPIFTLAADEGRDVFWVRIVVPAGRSLAALEAEVRIEEAVPVHVPSESLVIAMATQKAADAIATAGFPVELRAAVDDTSAFLIRDDRPVSVGFAGTEEEARAEQAFAFVSSALLGFAATVRSLGPGPGGVYVAADPGMPVAEVHIPNTGHGHSERLLADPSLLRRPGQSTAGLVATLAPGFAAGPSPELVERVGLSVTPEVIRGYVARLSGASDLATGQPPVRSRHIASDDNSKVVEILVRELDSPAHKIVARRHEFWYEGRRLENVEAELAVDGTAAVLVTAHLDSTAALGEFDDGHGHSRPFDPVADPAPGADDDASGVAAVLATAQCLKGLVEDGFAPTRTVRFALFNAEEQGLVGSKAYARAAAAAGDAIAAVLQMDMIAGNRALPKHRAEIHSGAAAGGAATELASRALADVVAAAAASAAPTLAIERYAGTTDPAAGRSDHASFHERGVPAVVVSENFFAGPTPTSPPASGTRQYHMPGDTLADADHDSAQAAEIGRAIATAALTLAGL